MKGLSLSSILLSILILFSYTTTSLAHFGLLYPSEVVVTEQPESNIEILIAFCHPFEQNGMDMVRPESFGLFLHGKKYDLSGTLKQTEYLGHKAWRAEYQVKRPGDHIFFVIPTPYWEEMEGKYIQHVTKVIVNGYGLENDWSRPVGLPQEIVPLTRPYGIWTGNLFCGRVLFDGRPKAGVDVEIEHLNQKGARIIAPKETFITQVVQTDENGEFCYSIPFHGWWGFAALTEKENAMRHQGKDVPLERGAVIWVEAADPKAGD